MTRKHFICIAESLSETLSQSTEEVFTYTFYRKLCKPFTDGLQQNSGTFQPEQFIAHSYNYYKEIKRNDIKEDYYAKKEASTGC